jgi:hypothetical protein
MPRVRCHYTSCVFIDDGYCGAAAIVIDPDLGCTTYSRVEDLDEDVWHDEVDPFEGYEDIDIDDDDDDLWLDED